MSDRIGTIQISNTSNNNNSTTIKYICSNSIQNTINYFMEYSTIAKYNVIEVKSLIDFYYIKFIIYNRNSTNDNHYIIVCKVVLNKITSENSYRINNSINSIHIENMGDIISLFAKISKGNIVYYKDQSIVDLINIQMERIATKIN